MRRNETNLVRLRQNPNEASLKTTVRFFSMRLEDRRDLTFQCSQLFTIQKAVQHDNMYTNVYLNSNFILFKYTNVYS